MCMQYAGFKSATFVALKQSLGHAGFENATLLGSLNRVPTVLAEMCEYSALVPSCMAAGCSMFVCASTRLASRTPHMCH